MFLIGCNNLFIKMSQNFLQSLISDLDSKQEKISELMTKMDDLRACEFQTLLSNQFWAPLVFCSNLTLIIIIKVQ